MNQAAVYDLFERIQQLPAEERSLLEDLMVEQEEREWQGEATSARRLSRQKGIDLAAIDRAVAFVRQG